MNWFSRIGLAILTSGCVGSLLFANPDKAQSPVLVPQSASLVNPIKPSVAGILTDTPYRSRWTVMAIGGSVAKGWNDTPNQGYLMRAIATVAKKLNLNITFWNKSIGGFTPEKLAPSYPRLLAKYHPNIVIISWGMLDDIAGGTPQKTFEASIQQEVALAVQSGAEVWVVTPPVTEASYAAKDSVLEQVYAKDEIQAARSVTPGNIHVFDLFNAMKHHLQQNHETITRFASNAWHPNPAGHILAGRILAAEILTRQSSLGL